MKDVRFYLEFDSVAKRKRSGRANAGHSGNVFARFLNGGAAIDGLGAVLFESNSPVACTGASFDFLRRCKRIREGLARQIHPRLFERLDGVVHSEVTR